jgi:GNAT superfamily N-acetyltransferase
MTETAVTRTYLEMTRRDQLRNAALEAGARVERADVRAIPFFRFLYKEVGQRYHWHDRLVWSDEQWRARVGAPGISIWVLYAEGTPAGYFENERHADGSVEIVYFGLMPEYVGRGLGKEMLSAAVERAWEAGATRVWLHTCTLDNPAALPNYLARGFTPFKTETYTMGSTGSSAAPAPVASTPPPA